MSKEKMVTEQFKVHVKWKIKCATLTEHVKVFNHYIYLLNHFNSLSKILLSKLLWLSCYQIKYQHPQIEKDCYDVLYLEQCKKFKDQGSCDIVSDIEFCKSTCGRCGTPVLLLSLFDTGANIIT